MKRCVCCACRPGHRTAAAALSTNVETENVRRVMGRYATANGLTAARGALHRNGRRDDPLEPPVDALDRGELLVAEPDAAQRVEDEVRFAEDVAVDVVWKLRGEPLLQLAVLTRSVGVDAKVVAERHLIGDSDRALRTHIQIVSRKIGRMIECLAIFDPEVAAMTIAEGVQALDRQSYVASLGYDYGHVDDRLGCETGDRR